MGGVPHSKQYKQLKSAIGFWNEMLRRKQGNQVKSKHLQQLIKKAAIPIPLGDINRSVRWGKSKQQDGSTLRITITLSPKPMQQELLGLKN
jgi:hypothetical protein